MYLRAQPKVSYGRCDQCRLTRPIVPTTQPRMSGQGGKVRMLCATCRASDTMHYGQGPQNRDARRQIEREVKRGNRGMMRAFMREARTARAS